MRFATAIVVLAFCLALQTGIGRLWPEAPRYIDIMLVPVVAYAIAGSQRSGMLVGCAAGLLQDVWFQAGAFGIGGFKKTFIGWALGGLGSRFDLNSQPSRFVFGVVASVVDSLLDLALRGLLDQLATSPSPAEIGIRAVISGVLVVGAFGIVRRVQRRGSGRSMA